MIRHVVLFTWKPEATEEQKGAVHAELAKMPPAIDAIRAYKYGRDVGAMLTDPIRMIAWS